MLFYLVLASVISLPGDNPAFAGEVIDETQFNDQKHVDRLLKLKHIKVTTAPVGDVPAEGDMPAFTPLPASSVSDDDLKKAAKDLGIANADKMTRENLELAILAVGK